MNTKRIERSLIAAVAATLILTGCASMDADSQQQAMGAGIGAALGCGVGALITHDARGCAAGAAIGGVVGFGAVALSQYHARQVRTAQQEASLYGLTKPVSGVQVKIRKGTASPKVVNPGKQVEVATRYSLFLPQGESSVAVSESWVLKKDGKTLTTIPAEAAVRSAGGFEVTGFFPVPANATPGTYVVEHVVKAGSSYDTDESSFVVKS
jgi:hypothetical protein